MSVLFNTCSKIRFNADSGDNIDANNNILNITIVSVHFAVHKKIIKGCNSRNFLSVDGKIGTLQIKFQKNKFQIYLLIIYLMEIKIVLNLGKIIKK